MKTLDLFQDMEAPKECQHVPVLTLTPNLVHYGREDCAKCKKFLRWLPKPPDAMKGPKP